MIKVVSFDIDGTLIENNENQKETKKYDLKSLTTLLYNLESSLSF